MSDQPEVVVPEADPQVITDPIDGPKVKTVQPMMFREVVPDGAEPPPQKPFQPRPVYGSKSGNGMSRGIRRGGFRIQHIQSGVTTFKQGRWPRGSQQIKRDGDDYRALLEDACFQMHGEVGVYAASVIQTCVTLETTARLLQKWLRDKWETLSDEAKDRRLALIGKARFQRDQGLRKLGLDKGIGGGDDDAWKEFWRAKPIDVNAEEVVSEDNQD